MIFKYLNKADFLSKSPSLNFKGNSRMNSTFGGILTLVYACFTFIATLYIGQELFVRNSPSLIFETKKNEESKILLTDYPIAFRFSDFNGIELGNNKDFMDSIRVGIRINNSNSEGVIGATFEIKECDESFVDTKFLKQARETRDNIHLFCPDFSKGYADLQSKEPSNANLYITKGFGKPGSSFMSVVIRECVGPTCKKFKHTNDLYYVTLIVPDSFTEISNFSDPINRTVDTIIGQVSDSFYTRQYIEIDQNYLKTDDGWFISNEKSELHYSIGKRAFEIAEFSEDFRAFYQFTLSSPDKDNIVKRRYVKVPEVMAFVGGFAKAVLLGFKMFINFYTNYWLKVEVVQLLNEDKSSNLNSSNEVIQLETRSKQSINPTQAPEKTEVSHFKQFFASLFYSSHSLNRKFDTTIPYLDILNIMKTVKTVDYLSTTTRQVSR